VTLELDHVLVFVDPAVPEVAALEAAGFPLTPVHPHPGQGTANRSLLFEENYLELIYLASRTEAESNVMRLDRRADWARTGASPFGFGLRGTIPPEAHADFWAYHPPYASPGRPPIWVHRGCHESRGAPLVFVMEPSAALPLERMPPRTWPTSRVVCHAHGATGISHVTVRTLGTASWPAGALVPSATLEPGPRRHLTIELDSKPFPPVEAGALLTVCGRPATPPASC
jgi:hypothetical protein